MRCVQSEVGGGSTCGGASSSLRAAGVTVSCWELVPVLEVYTPKANKTSLGAQRTLSQSLTIQSLPGSEYFCECLLCL